MFGKFGDMFKLQREAKKIKDELSRTHIEADIDGVKVTVNGSQEVVSIEIINKDLLGNEHRLVKALKEALNKAMEKAQKVAAERMKSIMGDMGMPGM